MPLSESEMDEPTLKDVLSAVLNIRSDISEFKNETNNVLSGLTKDMHEVKSLNTAMEQRVDTVEKINSNIIFEVEAIKQKQLSANLCITGITSNPNEDLYGILAKLCDCLGTEYNEDLFTSVYRTKGQMSSSIIVQCNSEETKHYFLAAKKSTKTIIVDQLELDLPNGTTPVNINSHLTPYFSHLLYIARQAVRRSEISAAWFTSKGIQIKLNGDDPQPIIIKTMSDLALYVTTTNPSKRKASEEINNPPKKQADNSTPADDNPLGNQTSTNNKQHNQQQNQQRNQQRNQEQQQQQKSQGSEQVQQKQKSSNRRNPPKVLPNPTPKRAANRLLRLKSTAT